MQDIKTKLNIYKLKDFMEDPKNWRPPSYSQIMKYMGWKSKNSVSKALKNLNQYVKKNTK